MKREYHRWYSSRLGIELGVVVYGHWGPPLLGFPTSAGDEWELEGQSEFQMHLLLTKVIGLIMSPVTVFEPMIFLLF